MGTKIVYNHRAIEKKWREKWEADPVNRYVPVSVRKRTSCRTLERLCDLRCVEPL